MKINEPSRVGGVNPYRKSVGNTSASADVRKSRKDEVQISTEAKEMLQQRSQPREAGSTEGSCFHRQLSSGCTEGSGEALAVCEVSKGWVIPLAIQDLINNLQEQTEVHNQLLQIALEKKAVIISDNIDALNQLVNREAKLIKQINKLEEIRLFELNRFIVGKGFRPDSKITISVIIKLVFNADEKVSLMKAQKELLSVLDQLKEVNDFNQQLIQQSLKFINYSLEIMSGNPDDDAIYRHPGHQSTGHSRPGMFDTRA